MHGDSQPQFRLRPGVGNRQSARSLRVIEGVSTAAALVARAAGLDLPICTAVADLLGGRLSLIDAMTRLLARKLREEV